MITNSKMPAITPAILTVWSVCFSGSGTGFGVTAPGDEKESKWVRQNKDVTFKNNSIKRHASLDGLLKVSPVVSC